MKQMDKDCATLCDANDEEELFLAEVIRGDSELFFLDTYLSELFGR